MTLSPAGTGAGGVRGDSRASALPLHLPDDTVLAPGCGTRRLGSHTPSPTSAPPMDAPDVATRLSPSVLEPSGPTAGGAVSRPGERRPQPRCGGRERHAGHRLCFISCWDQRPVNLCLHRHQPDEHCPRPASFPARLGPQSRPCSWLCLPAPKAHRPPGPCVHSPGSGQAGRPRETQWEAQRGVPGREGTEPPLGVAEAVLRCHVAHYRPHWKLLGAGHSRLSVLSPGESPAAEGPASHGVGRPVDDVDGGEGRREHGAGVHVDGVRVDGLE